MAAAAPALAALHDIWLRALVPEGFLIWRPIPTALAKSQPLMGTFRRSSSWRFGASPGALDLKNPTLIADFRVLGF